MNFIDAIAAAFRGMFARHPSAVSGYDEAYLAEAQDLYDLERRMRSLDQHGRNGSLYSNAYLSLYPAGTGR